MLLCVPKIILRLLIDPTFRRGVKGDGKAHSHFRADTGTAIQYGGERLATYAQPLGCFRHAKFQRLKTKRFDDFAGMGRIVHTHENGLLSDNLHNQQRQRLFRQIEM